MIKMQKELNGFSVWIPDENGYERHYVYNTFLAAAKRIGTYFGHPKEPEYPVAVVEVPVAPPAPKVERPNLID